MKILLINIQNSASRPGYAGLFLPFGLAYISSVLKNKGFEVDCLDLHTEETIEGKNFNSENWIKFLEFLEYDVVGFGGVFAKFKELKFLSEKIWEFNKNIFQIAGGHMATMISDIILRQTRIKCVCLYEGEETIVQLLKSMQLKQEWTKVAGIKYLDKKNQVIQTAPRNKIEFLDSLPFPDWKGWSFDIIKKAFPTGSPGRYCAIMFASRGCPFSCIFCNPTSGRLLRTRSAKNIVEEIKLLKKEWNVRYIRFFDEVFIGPKDKIKELCYLMIKEKLKVFWYCTTQVRLVDEELLRLMKEAGCIEIAYGVESGSDKILTEMNKGITKQLAKDVIQMTYSIGIRPSLSFIAGTFSENSDTLKETKEFITSLNYINWTDIPYIGYIVPLPHTKIYEEAKNRGLIRDEERYLTEDMFKFSKFSKAINLTKMQDKDFFASIKKFNSQIKRDFYRKHPFKKILSVVGLDHLRLDLIFKDFSLSQLRPVLEALLWATMGKRNNFFCRCIASLIYKN